MSFKLDPEDNDQISLSVVEVSNIIEDINENYSPVENPIEVSSIVDNFTNHQTTCLSAKALREVSDNISRYYSPHIPYHARKLVLMPVDPTHIYAYWSLGDFQQHAMQEPLEDETFIIKVFAQTIDSSDNQKKSSVKPVYQTTVDRIQSNTIIKVPFENQPAVYSAFIGTNNKQEKFVPVIKSNDINMHSQPVESELSVDSAYSAIQNDLSELSQTTESNIVEKTHYASSNHSGQRLKE